MGCLLKKSQNNANNYERISQKEKIIPIRELPENHYFCPNCDNIPEILHISAENGSIGLKCKKHDIIELYINDFLDKCEKSKSKKPKDNENLISQNVKYCETCKEYINDRESISKHQNHDTIKLSLLNDIIKRNNFIKNIEEKNNELANNIRFNSIIINSYQNFKQNFNHIQSVINLGNSIKIENGRHSGYIEHMVQNLEKKLEDEKEEIDVLINKYKIQLSGDEEILILKNRKLGDKGLELLSKIQFKNLKEINLSQNEIKNIEPLKNMNLSNLQKIDLSFNEIESIQIFKELKAPYLKDICLQNNKIGDFSPINDNECFKDLQRLRIEANQKKKVLDSFKNQLIKKFKRINLYSEVISWDKFVEKYKVKIKDKKNRIDSKDNKDKKQLDLSDKRAGDIVLEELYNIIGNDKSIKLNILILRNNDINDCSLLSRIHLLHLRILDLSVNKIKNLDFLINMKMPKLKNLFLDKNYINKLKPLLNIKKIKNLKADNEIKHNFKSLEVISLLDNNFESNDDEVNFIIDKLQDIEIDLKLFK